MRGHHPQLTSAGATGPADAQQPVQTGRSLVEPPITLDADGPSREPVVSFHTLTGDWKNPKADKRQAYDWTCLPNLLEGSTMQVTKTTEAVDPDTVQQIREMAGDKFKEEMAFRTTTTIRPVGAIGAGMAWRTAEERGLTKLLSPEVAKADLTPLAQATVLDRDHSWAGKTYLHAFVEAFGLAAVEKALADYQTKHPE